jgi:outer membrane protein OmpA-like peptidoglycan-associated protein
MMITTINYQTIYIITLQTVLILRATVLNLKKRKIEIFTKKDNLTVTPLVKVISPDNNGIADQQDFAFTYTPGKGNPVTDWQISILDSDKNVVFNKGQFTPLPVNYLWSGETNNNTPLPGNDNRNSEPGNNTRLTVKNIRNGETSYNTSLPDGDYTAKISLNTFYGVSTTVTTPRFSIDLTAPDIELEKDKGIFSPDGDGIDDTVSFKFIKADDNTGIKNWELSIISPFTDSAFISYTGKGAPSGEIIWDGIGKNGQMVGSAEDYKIIVTSEDTVGNSVVKMFDHIWTDILITKMGDGRLKISISNIHFKPNHSVMTDEAKNIEILNLLVKALTKYPAYTILLEGYANRYEEKANEKQGYKLSQNRANVISKELQKRGIAKERMTTIGKGFENPIIQLRDNMSDEERKEMNVNRRVEFYLTK